MRENDSVNVTTTNLVGNITFVGTAKVTRIRKDKYGNVYELRCDDGKKREVAPNNPHYKHDAIMVL